MKRFLFFGLCVFLAACLLLIHYQQSSKVSRRKPPFKVQRVKPRPPEIPQKSPVASQKSRPDIPPLFIPYKNTTDFLRGENAKRWLEQKEYTVKRQGNSKFYFLYEDDRLVTHGHQVTYYQNALWIAALKPEYDPDKMDQTSWEKRIQGWRDEGYTQKSADWLKTRPDIDINPENVEKRAIIMPPNNNVIITKDDNGTLIVFFKSR
ncbi:hypothetical protein F4055_13195 [Candidatus Poribacteria bacterium]|nr:hypothetical protein [Candidatus Poribacteria bacterium]